MEAVTSNPFSYPSIGTIPSLTWKAFSLGTNIPITKLTPIPAAVVRVKRKETEHPFKFSAVPARGTSLKPDEKIVDAYAEGNLRARLLIDRWAFINGEPFAETLVTVPLNELDSYTGRQPISDAPERPCAPARPLLGSRVKGANPDDLFARWFLTRSEEDAANLVLTLVPFVRASIYSSRAVDWQIKLHGIEDAVQDILTKVLALRRPTKNIQGYVWTAIENYGRDDMEDRCVSSPGEDAMVRAVPVPYNPRADQTEAEDVALNRLEGEISRAAFSKDSLYLTPTQSITDRQIRQIAELAQSGSTMRQIADAMKLTEQSVRRVVRNYSGGVVKALQAAAVRMRVIVHLNPTQRQVLHNMQGIAA